MNVYYVIKSAVNVEFRVHISKFAQYCAIAAHGSSSCKTRINAVREQALLRCYCYSCDINRDAICSARLQRDSAKCSFPRITLSAGARETRQKFAGGDCFPCFPIESSRNYFRCPFHSFVQSSDWWVDRSANVRSIANRDTLFARSRWNVKTLRTIYDTGSPSSSFLRHLRPEIIAGWMESGLSLFLGKLSCPRNFRR